MTGIKTHEVFSDDDDFAGFIEYLSGEYIFFSENDYLPEYSCWTTESSSQSGTIRQLESFISTLESKGFYIETL